MGWIKRIYSLQVMLHVSLNNPSSGDINSVDSPRFSHKPSNLHLAMSCISDYVDDVSH